MLTTLECCQLTGRSVVHKNIQHDKDFTLDVEYEKC